MAAMDDFALGIYGIMVLTYLHIYLVQLHINVKATELRYLSHSNNRVELLREILKIP